jgi:urease accessory protein
MSNINQNAGHGKITAQIHNNQVVFPVLSYMYPLKLLSPRMQQEGVAVVYMMTYGGGLVGGDRISLSINIEKDAQLVILSQVCSITCPIILERELKRAHAFPDSDAAGLHKGIQSQAWH